MAGAPTAVAERTRQHKEAFITLASRGLRLKDIEAEVGVAHNTYLSWRQRDPEFKTRFDVARNQKLSAEAKKRVLGDGDYDGRFASFRRIYMHLDTYFVHQAIVDAIETCPPMGVVLILCPPESGKTTTLVDYLAKRIGEDANIRVLYASGRQTHVKKQLRRLKNRMTDTGAFSAYIARFGPFEPESNDKLRTWREDAITVAGADHDEADFTFEARSITSEVVGGRADVMVLDDLQSHKTLSQTEAIVERVRQDYISRLGRKSILVVIGTRVGPGDVYEELERAGIVNRVVRIPAVFDDRDPEPCPHEDGTCTCVADGHPCGGVCIARHPNGQQVPHYPSTQPEMWDSHSLAVKRLQVGELAWARNYQQKGIAKGDATFDERLTEKIKDPMRPLGLSFGFVRRLGGEASLHNIAGLDPALVGGCALTTAACTAKSFHVIDCHQETNVGRPEAIVSMVRFAAETYGLAKLVVEVNAYQKAFAEEYHDGSLNALAAEYGFMVVPHTCVDTETEVLAQRGWLRSYELKVGDRILTLNMQTGASEWKPVRDVYRSHYSGPMIAIDNQTVNALTTLDHKWAVTEQRALDAGRRDLRFVEAQHLNTNCVIPLARPQAADDDPVAAFTDDFVELIGWAVTEGHYARRGWGIEISQSDTANPHNVERIRLLLKRLGADFREELNRRTGVRKFALSGSMARQVRLVTGGAKHLIPELIAGLPSHQRRLLIDTMVTANGWRRRKAAGHRASEYFCSNTESLAEAFEMLCALEGRPTTRTVRRVPDHPHSQKTDGEHDHFVVCAKWAERCWLGNHREHPPARVDYDGEIWCPNTENGTFYARRGGVTYFTGNTGLNKLDDDLGVAAMATNMRMGEIDVCWGDELAVERIGALIDELHVWRPGVRGNRLRQDRVMSMWFAYLEWQRSRRSLKANTSDWGREGMPGRMTDYTALFKPKDDRRRRGRSAHDLLGVR